jgi:hypothetical protein
MKYYGNLTEEGTTDVNGAWKALKPLSEGFEFAGEDQQYDDFGGKRFYNAVDPITAAIESVGDIASSVGDVATAVSNRKVAELKLAEIGGKRSAQLKDCENNKAFKKIGDLKYRRSRINECQSEVKKRIDAEEKEQRDIIRKSLEIEQQKVGNTRAEIDSKDNKKFIYIGIGVLALAGIVYVLMKKKK